MKLELCSPNPNHQECEVEYYFDSVDKGRVLTYG